MLHAVSRGKCAQDHKSAPVPGGGGLVLQQVALRCRDERRLLSSYALRNARHGRCMALLRRHALARGTCVQGHLHAHMRPMTASGARMCSPQACRDMQRKRRPAAGAAMLPRDGL
jgi:hypothetical protein